MRLLFLLLWRNNFTLLFLLLQGLCIYLLVNNNRFQKASVLNATNKVVTTVDEGVSYVQEYIHLRENNTALANENAQLRARLEEARYISDTTHSIVYDSSYRQQYTFINARVINNSVNRRNNYLTLSVGSAQGVKPEMGVITSNGVVGIVNHVSEHFCTVMSLLHKETSLSCMIRNNRFFGSLKWEGGDPGYVVLKEIDKTVPVSKGDTIVTTSFSKMFPANVLIGTVSEARVEPGSPFHSIRIKLAMRFDNLSHVYVVNNLMKAEQDSIEANNQPKEGER
jgi:rod shape-determining protein MreC